MPLVFSTWLRPAVWACLLLLQMGGVAEPMQSEQEGDGPRALAVEGAVRGVHDPAIAKEGDTYYLFGSGADWHRSEGVRPQGSTQETAQSPARDPAPDAALEPQLPIRCSKNLRVWTRCGSVFQEIPEWIRTASPKTTELWAPDVAYADGLYWMYYAYSIFGKNTSGIALATNRTLDPHCPQYRWVDRGLVLRSEESDDWNAIDPNLLVDEDEHKWLTYGSYWSGIKLRRLDDATGLLPKHRKAIPLAARGQPWAEHGGLLATAEEGPFLFRHGGWYYLFVSWDFCCRGAKSNYREMVGRSRKITGPYVDREGRRMREDGGTEVLAGNKVWVGPGGASLLHDGLNDLIVFHAYSVRDGRPSLQISTVTWEDGWPKAVVRTEAGP